MYVGHFAIGLAIKAVRPQTPALPIMMGVGFMDMVDGILIVLGLDHVTPNLASGPYLFFDLTFIDWDHSLLMAVVLSLLWAAFFLRDQATAVVAAVAVFSHFLADWPVHNHDLALYPYSVDHLGYGLWGKLGILAWVLEGVFAAVLAASAWRVRARAGVSLFWPCLLLALLFVQLSPWLSPMMYVATLELPTADIVHGIVVTAGFLIPALLFTWLINRAEPARLSAG